MCDASFSRHRNLKGHISKVHEQNRAHAIHERDIFEPVTQITEQNLSDKEKSKTGFKEIDAFQCPICQLKFPSRTKIEEHFIKEHEGLKPYHCSICDARFSKQKGKAVEGLGTI
jgi:rubredoxin